MKEYVKTKTFKTFEKQILKSNKKVNQDEIKRIYETLISLAELNYQIINHLK